MDIYKFKLEKEIKIKSEDIKSILYFFFDESILSFYKKKIIILILNGIKNLD